MFKFGFDLDLEDEDETLGAVDPASGSTESANEQVVIPSQPFREVAFDELFATLPPSLSYCPLPLPAHVSSSVSPIVRRDMFDAHFQLIASASEEEVEGDKDDEEPESTEVVAGAESAAPAPAVWGPETDLVKGVYEGGMKTWECAGDLVGVLQAEVVSSAGWRAVEGKRIMEVGCGTAIPSIYLLQELLAKPEAGMASERPPRTTFYFLDYNELVLKLVTLPNIVLAFRHLFAPPASAAASVSSQPHAAADPNARRSTSPAPSSADGAADVDEDEDDDDEESDSLTLSAARLARFRELLAKRNIELRFYAGGWDSYALSDGSSDDAEGAKMDIVLTSETVYQIANLPALVALLRQASYPTDPPSSSSSSTEAGTSKQTTTALVAAKVLYFGLEGGGVPAFEDAVRATPEGAGWTTEVWRSESGVKRWVGRVGWAS